MSSESSSDESLPPLSLELSGLSSADDSLASSPTGILSPSCSHASSSTSLNGKLNVKFAPLPELVPRTRRSSVPLGIAARSQMVSRRRQQRGAYVNPNQNNPMWTPEELEQQREFAMREGQRRHNQHHLMYEEEEEEEEDPLLVLGRMVKVAGKTLWRKVSIKDLSKKAKRENGGGAYGKDKQETRAYEAPTSKEDQRPALKPRIPCDEEKDNDEESLRTIGQTETIRGDAKCMSISEEPSAVHRTPTQASYNSH